MNTIRLLLAVVVLVFSAFAQQTPDNIWTSSPINVLGVHRTPANIPDGTSGDPYPSLAFTYTTFPVYTNPFSNGVLAPTASPGTYVSFATMESGHPTPTAPYLAFPPLFFIEPVFVAGPLAPAITIPGVNSGANHWFMSSAASSKFAGWYSLDYLQGSPFYPITTFYEVLVIPSGTSFIGVELQSQWVRNGPSGVPTFSDAIVFRIV